MHCVLRGNDVISVGIAHWELCLLLIQLSPPWSKLLWVNRISFQQLIQQL